MDFTSLPEPLIYRKRKSLEEFTNDNEMNEHLVDNMLDMVYLQSTDFKERVTECFNAAYYICTLILAEKHPEWSLPKFYQIALCNQKLNTVSQAISLSIVRVYLSHFGNEWHNKHKKLVDKLDTFLNSHWLEKGDPFLNDYSFMDAFNQINSFEVATAPFSLSDFALRDIDQEAIDELRVTNFSWTTFTNYYNYKTMNDIVLNVGKNEDEKITILNSLRHDAEEFYSKNSPYLETVRSNIDEIEHDVYLYYHYADHEAMMQAELEELKYQDDIRPYQARITELEKTVECLNKQLSERGIAKDENIFKTADNNYQPQPDSNTVVETNTSDSASANLQNQLTEAKKKIEEQVQVINDLNETIADAQKRTLLMSKKKDKREGIQIGLTREQWVIFGKFLAEKLDLKYTNKKQLAPILHALSGWGEKSLSNLMSAYLKEEDEKYVASIFGSLSPGIAKEIYKNWDESILPPWNVEEKQQK